MVTIRLKQFRTVVETGNLRKAADLLGISHSGLSKSMKSLEQELGIRLLLPSGRGIVITDEGLGLYERSGPFLAELQRLVGKSEARRRDLIRLGSFEVFTSQFVGRLIREHPDGTEVEVHELIPGKLEEALLLNKIDIGITYEPIPRKGIEYLRVASLFMGCYALKGAFRGRETLSVPFVVPANPLEGAPSGVKGLDAWPDDRFKRNTPYSVDLLATGMELVRQGLCAIFIPQFFARFHNESIRPELRLEQLELPARMSPVKRDIFIVKRESTQEDFHFKRIAKALRKLVS